MSQKITSLMMPTVNSRESFTSANLQSLKQYDPKVNVGIHRRTPEALYLPQSIVELLTIDRAEIKDFVLNSDDEIAQGFIGHYRSWPVVTDALDYGPKVNFTTPQIFSLVVEPRAAYEPQGTARLPADVNAYTKVESLLSIIYDANENRQTLLITREVWLVMADSHVINDYMVVSPVLEKLQQGYIGSFANYDVVVPIHDSAYVPEDLEQGMYLFSPEPMPSNGVLVMDYAPDVGDDDDQPLGDDAMKKTVALIKGFDHDYFVLYDDVANIEASEFRKIELDKVNSFDDVEKIGDGEVYFFTKHVHSKIIDLAHTDEKDQLQIAALYENLISGFLGTLHGRPLVTDSFANPALMPSRSDLNGLYVVKAAPAS